MRRFTLVLALVCILMMVFATEGLSEQTKKVVHSGKVVETMNAAGYTYVLLLDKSGEKIWFAMPLMEIKQGQKLSFGKGNKMVDFHSKTFDRTFEKIFFLSGPIGSGNKADLKSLLHRKAKVSIPEKITVTKASEPNAYTVEELFSKREELSNKKVIVRGLVVKLSGGIDKMNWIHLRDGTGKSRDDNNDILIISKARPKAGTVVKVEGILAKDKNLGPRYHGGSNTYPAVIEKATIIE